MPLLQLLLCGVGALVLAGCARSAIRTSAAGDAAQAGMVDVAALAPDIVVEMRYAGANNFTGAPVPGYEAPRCYLLRPAAEALARVQQRLRQRGESLVLYDCYRPTRAVRRFVAWARDSTHQATKARYYPNLDKSQLLGGYIAESSGHSRGATADVGLLQCDTARVCRPFDMGTPFDFFDPIANTDAADITSTQRRYRQRLLQAMHEEGFENYPMEWWHYSFRPDPSPRTAYDFPVR